MEKSDWKHFGYDNSYRINTDGVVMSRNHPGRSYKGPVSWKTIKATKSNTDKSGGWYLTVNIKVSASPSVYKTMRIHRIVTSLFIGEVPKGMEVDHIDGNRANNSVRNLRIVSRKLNAQNASERGAFLKGKLAFSGKIKIYDYIEILKMLKEGFQNKQIANRFNVDPSVISQIKNGKWRGSRYATVAEDWRQSL